MRASILALSTFFQTQEYHCTYQYLINKQDVLVEVELKYMVLKYFLFNNCQLIQMFLFSLHAY